MKKGFAVLTIVAISITSLMPAHIYAISSSGKERKEVIVKYRDESETAKRKVENDVKKKYKLQRLERKKVLDIEGEKLDVIETGETDNVEVIAEKISKEPNVEFAVPNHKIKRFPYIDSKKQLSLPKDSKFNLQWGLYNKGQEIEGVNGTAGIDIDVLKAWKITKGSPNVVVGVLDTGIDINHKDLKKNIFINKREIPRNGKDDDKTDILTM